MAIVATARLMPASSTEDRRMNGFRCPGRKRDGRACNKMIAEMDVDAVREGRTIRIKCPACNAMNVFTGSTAA